MGDELRLVDHDGAWASRFAKEAERLRDALAAHIVVIEHVGSTAVPGLAGKPVLDIAVAVSSEPSADACIAPLEALGYEYRGPHGDDPRRRYYVRDVAGQRAVQIHLYILPAPAWEDKLTFRDALRSDRALALAYVAEKQRAATVVGWDKGAYSVEKGRFIEAVLRPLRVASAVPPHSIKWTQHDLAFGISSEASRMAGSLKLRRSNDRVIAGVCGGIAVRFDVPVGRVRLVYVALSVLSAGFPGILVYLVLWALMPKA
jgi:GrpB-like predicted nucleotidyltransferase (UPF0157 family)/phage shock protein PspC (stress-responsive transcriptional regulator)